MTTRVPHTTHRPSTKEHTMKTKLIAVLLTIAVTLGSVALANTRLTAAHQNTPDSIIGIAFDRMAALASEYSDGRITIEVFHGGTLGQERELIEQTMAGVVDLMIASPGNLGVFEPAASILALPFLYRDIDHVRAVVDGPLFDEFNARFIQNLGVRAIATGFPGFRFTYTKGKPITSLADFAGMRIRVPPSDIHRATFAALGANPTPMAFGEIYTGLQTGVVEGLENVNEFIYTPSLHEQLDYATRTNHMFEPWTILVNEQRLQSLTEADRSALLRAATQAWEEQRQSMAERTIMFQDLLIAAGIEFLDIERDPLVAATASVRRDFVTAIPGGQALVDAILAAGQ
jgi:TRAP-type transport system periplasmic protein